MNKNIVIAALSSALVVLILSSASCLYSAGLRNGEMRGASEVYRRGFELGYVEVWDTGDRRGPSYRWRQTGNQQKNNQQTHHKTD